MESIWNSARIRDKLVQEGKTVHVLVHDSERLIEARMSDAYLHSDSQSPHVTIGGTFPPTSTRQSEAQNWDSAVAHPVERVCLPTLPDILRYTTTTTKP